MIRIIKEELDYSRLSDEDIKIHKSIDWKARDYRDYPVEDDSFMGTAMKYSVDSKPETKRVKFIKYFRANPIFPPYYKPSENPFSNDTVGPVYNGKTHNGYLVMDRYDTEELSDILSR